MKVLLYPPRVKELHRAREALAQAHFHTAQLELRQVLRAFPNGKPDRDELPPDFYAFCSEERENAKPKASEGRDGERGCGEHGPGTRKRAGDPA